MAKISYEQIIKECNDECKRCREDYEKAGIEFRTSMCTYCKNGQKLHEAEMATSKAEREWGKQDWNSSQLKDYYHG